MQEDTKQVQPDAIVIYHSISAEHNANEALDELMQVIKYAQDVRPGCRRIINISINGHRNVDGSFSSMMTDLQLRLIPQRIVPYLSEVVMPLGTYLNEHQDNEVPDQV